MNIDLAPTFLSVAGVQVPPHMDGKSFLPLVVNRRKNIKDRWADTFLIESSGRRETPEQLMAHRARMHALAIQHQQQLNETGSLEDYDHGPSIGFSVHRKQTDLSPFFSSHEDDNEDDDDDDEEDGKHYNAPVTSTIYLCLFSSCSDITDQLSSGERSNPDMVKVEVEDYSIDVPEMTDEEDAIDDPTIATMQGFDDDMDARESSIFHSPYYNSKIKRLNLECSDPYMQQNCVRGQKWRCINENGRWRKHKCKFLAQVQSHMDAISQFAAQNKRNCACFTKKGVIYTKIKSDRNANSVLRHKRSRDRFHELTENMKTIKQINTILNRSIRNTDNHIVSQHQEFYDELLHHARHLRDLESHRQKRETSSKASSMIEDLTKALENIEARYKAQRFTNTTTTGAAKCYVRGDGQVSCSNVIYDDELAWRRSSDEISALIQVLKAKIEDLKEIKKHLRENRPLGVTVDYDNENLSLSTEDYTESSGAVPSTTRRSQKQSATVPSVDSSTSNRHRHRVSGGSRHRQRTSTTASVFGDIRSSNTSLDLSSEYMSSTTTTPTTTNSSPSSEYESSGSSSTTAWDETMSAQVKKNRISQAQPTSSYDFNERTVSVGATIFEPQKYRGSVRVSTTQSSEYSQVNDTLEGDESGMSFYDRKNQEEPAECYCEPEIER